MGYTINVKKFGIAFLIGIVVVFMFLLVIAPQYRWTGVTIEHIDRIFYTLLAFIIGISVLVSLEQKWSKISKHETLFSFSILDYLRSSNHHSFGQRERGNSISDWPYNIQAVGLPSILALYTILRRCVKPLHESTSIDEALKTNIQK